ncbi:SH2 domain-containing adapter protein B isoform X12 [Pipistrellus kuhlii]|uniref:SH2 domain-containing adapter protein B isoform X12 n=1 Tax=Pipistrellus kuhlii TaxID=59472 RepID=UPI00174F0FEB|nr:SH2 domain-containing adapter protein B isoform X12 [Pipistrellus kuhlii]
MAKWLNKYFSLGNSKTKSPPQPPRPDYREQRRRGGDRPSQQPPQAVPQASASSSASCGPAAASCFSALSGSLPDDSGSTSDLIRAYRAQKERDFEDPYNGPGSSLRKLRAMCRLDYCGGGGEPGGGQRAFSASSASGAAGCCCASSGAGAAAASSSSGSPHLYRSSSERRPATPAEVRYISPKHRLIKVESAVGSAAGDPSGGACSGGRTWSPTACGGKKLLNKCAASAAEESGSGKKEKVIIADDYSDPFDAKNDLKSKAGKGESAGYMEPYEAQRIMTEFQRQESVRSQHKGIQLYDTPYEPEGQSFDSDSESTVSPRLRESKLPQDDDRPADEYDQPWEWNRVTIPALAGVHSDVTFRGALPALLSCLHSTYRQLPSLTAARSDSRPPRLPGTGGASFELPEGASSPSNTGAPSSVGSWAKEWILLSRWRSKCKFSEGAPNLGAQFLFTALPFLYPVVKTHRLRKC